MQNMPHHILSLNAAIRNPMPPMTNIKTPKYANISMLFTSKADPLPGLYSNIKGGLDPFLIPRNESQKMYYEDL